MFVEILDEVLGNIECLFLIEDIIPDLGQYELVAPILIVLLQLGADFVH